ncbi:hypothetical protein EV424DRAFT_1545814 [Suillus variegatus]|nr:hypothetical protein EV424DRAFT_1545814 [Suillus variegatus]
MAAVDDHPSGSDKGQIYQNIAKLLFAGHPKYGAAYTINPKKFCNAVGNHIGTGKYKKLKATFSSTGTGVMPAEGTQAKNLLVLNRLIIVDAALSELPWYTELDAIWHSNPSMAAVTHSSKLGVDHAGALYSLVQSRGGAGPPTHFGTTSQWSPHTPTYPSPSGTAPSHYGQAYSPGPHIPHHANTLEMPHAGSSQFAPAPALTSAPAPLTPAAAPFTPAAAPLTPAAAPFTPAAAPFTPAAAPFTLAAAPFTPAPAPFTSAPAPAPSHTAPYNASPQFHLPSLPTPKDALDNHNTEDNDFDQDSSGLFDAPLGDYFEDDDMMVDEMTNSPSRVAGKKWQLPSSPSPPPNAPEPFHRPAKSPASSYNNRSADVVEHVDAFVNNTKYYLNTSLPTSAGSSKKKKARSDVMEQVDQMKDEIQSMHSDAMFRHDSKHQHFLAKLDTKNEHNHDIKKYEWLRTNREHEASQATVSHQWLQETKDAEICLRETDIRVHEAHSLVLKKEAEILRLKIQYHQMMQAGKASSDGGAG